MALFRVRYTEVTVSYMDIEADSEAQAEEFLETVRENHHEHTMTLLAEEAIDKIIEPISWEESCSAVYSHDEVKAWLAAYEEGSLSVMNYPKL